MQFRFSDITGTAFNFGGSPTQLGIWLNGDLGEVGLYPSNLAPADVSKLEANERAYYGF
jgi:hypothetical protein